MPRVRVLERWRQTGNTVTGFTLIELLIVVAIIGILAAIAIPNFRGAQIRAKASRAKEDLRSLETAVQQYSIEWARFMPDWDDYPQLAIRQGSLKTGAPATVRTRPEFPGANTFMGFLQFIPLSTPVAYISAAPREPWTRNASYSYNTRFEFSLSANPSQTPNSYTLSSCGPDLVTGDWGHFWAGLGNQYDPSNGLVSRGDIFIAVDNWREGRRLGHQNIRF